MPFSPLSEHELLRLADDALIAHVRGARDAGDREQAVLAIRVLVFGHWHNVRRRVALKVPPQDVDDVAGEVITSAIRSAFDGGSVGEFVTWLGTVTKRRIADYHRRREGEPSFVGLPVATGEDEHGPELPGVSAEGLVETRDAIERALEPLSDVHRRAIELHVFTGLSARETGDQLELSEDNVAQIATRFRRRLREELEP